MTPKRSFNSVGGILLKRFIYYFSWVLVIVFICYLGSRYYLSLKAIAESTFDYKGIFIFNLIFPILMGMLLKFPGLIKDIQHQKKWTFDWVKLLAIGTPTLYIATIPIWSYSSFGQNFLWGTLFTDLREG